MPYNPFANKTVEEFIIGSEADCELKIDFCNGPLKAGSTYWVKVRAFTGENKYTDTEYSEPIVTGKLNKLFFIFFLL